MMHSIRGATIAAVFVASLLLSSGCAAPAGGMRYETGDPDTPNDLDLPFAVDDRWAQEKASFKPWPYTTVYRHLPHDPPVGLPVVGNVYASVRAIDVATGKIVWINTVNVQTSGVTEVTGLERLGMTMADNFAGKESAPTRFFIYNGTEFKYPANWEDVKKAWPKRYAQGPNAGQYLDAD